MKVMLASLHLLITLTIAHSQNSIDNVLMEVSKNNKNISVNKQYWDSQKILFSTNNTPKGPRSSEEY